MAEKSNGVLADAVRTFLDIARLKSGPEDLPAMGSVLGMTVLAYVLASLAFGALLPSEPGSHTVALLVVDTALMLAWVRGMLVIARKPERYLQTTTAVFGFQLVLTPLFALAMAFFLRVRDDPAWQVPASLAIMVLGIWALVINTRIFRSATGWSTLWCVVLVIGQALVARVLIMGLFPEAAGTDLSLAP